jgi:microcystin degradation protein MlrC
VDNLVVNSHLGTVVGDDKDADAATAVVEGLGKAAGETALVKDGKTLLDITGLGHGDNATILTDVENAVLLEDRAEHVLDNDRGGGVGDEAGLLVELLGEQVNTEVAVLASLGGGGDADDLARAALKDQEIANADVVAGDGDGVGGRHLACGCGGGRNVRGRMSSGSGSWGVANTDYAGGRSSG